MLLADRRPERPGSRVRSDELAGDGSRRCGAAAVYHGQRGVCQTHSAYRKYHGSRIGDSTVDKNGFSHSEDQPGNNNTEYVLQQDEQIHRIGQPHKHGQQTRQDKTFMKILLKPNTPYLTIWLQNRLIYEKNC